MIERAILVTGNRIWTSRESIHTVLNDLVREAKSKTTSMLLINGGAKGVDLTADAIARDMGFAVARMDANWDVYKKAAGPIRNGWMLDVLMAFPVRQVIGFHNNIEQSKGTRNMLSRAHKAKVPWTLYDDQANIVRGTSLWLT